MKNIHFVQDILKYIKEQDSEEDNELKEYFEGLGDYMLLVGIKVDRK